MKIINMLFQLKQLILTHFKLKSMLVFLIGIYLGGTQIVQAATVAVHDPSVVIAYKDANGNSYPENDAAKTRTKYYYVFGTQLGAAYSTDMINWTNFTPTFSINGVPTTNYYQLVKSEGDYAEHTNTNEVRGNLWAPDIIYNKALGKWTLYFSLSGNGFKSSIIMFSSTKIEGNYERVGDVVFGGFTNNVTSDARTDYAKVTGTTNIDGRYLDNAGAWDNTYSVSCIDPAVTYDESGKLWLTYGSWSGGIFLLKLNEQTGLRDYTYNYGFGANPVWNGSRLRYDPYMGIHIAGGYYVSGEGAYVKYIKDSNGVGNYYLFVSMGFYSPEGGYTMRVFRSNTIGGVYIDVTGDNAVFANWVFNYGNNVQYGMPIMQNYKYNWWSTAEVAQGHNSVLTDEDGSAYLVYHTKEDNGTAFHNVEVHQLFFNENGWPLAAPFEYRKNFGLSKTQHSKEDVTGRYSVITHNAVDYATLKSNAEAEMYVNADGTLTGAYTGTWVYNFSAGKQYITLTTNAGTFKGAVCEQLMDGISTRTIAFTAMNSANERCLWGYKRTNTATINTTVYSGKPLLIGDTQYSLAFGDYNSFNKQTVSGDFEVEYTFDNNTQAAENWHNWAIAIRSNTEIWYLRADAFSSSTFTGSTVAHSYTWDWAQFKDIYKNKKVKLKISRVGTSINVFAYVNNILVYTGTSKNSPTNQVDVYLGGETAYLGVDKISVSQLGARQVVGTTNQDGTYTVPFNSNRGNTTTVSGNFELRYNFNNYHNPKSTNAWDNYILRVISGGNTMLLRADAAALDIFGNMSYTYSWTANNFISIMTGANVDMKISRSGTTITYKATITARDGNVYNYQAIQTNAPTTDMSFGFTGEASMQDFFQIEKTTNVISKTSVYIYNYDNSGNFSWNNANSWTPKSVPTASDTVIIRTGEVQIANINHTAPMYVESNGILRLIDTSTVANLHLQGGTLKASTTDPGMMLTSNITVEQPSTIMAGSAASTIFTLNGTITGGGNLTKTSVGNLRINSTATGFKGNWIITDGKLQLRSATGSGVCGVQVKNGARLDIEVAGATIYSLVVDNTSGIDLDQPLTTSVAVLGSDNILSGTYKNANYPTYIGSTAALTISNSLVTLSGATRFCTGSDLTLTAASASSYIWKNNATQVATTAAYKTTVAGNYIVDATNSAGCKVTSAAITTSLEPIQLNPTITSTSNAFCAGGSLLLTASTGTSYKWFNGTTQVGTAATYNAMNAGAYTVEVTNSTGCKATSAIKTITVNPLPTITPYAKVDAGAWTATASSSTCEGNTLNLGPQPTVAAGWSWTGPNNFTSALRDPILTNLVVANAGNYIATYTDQNGCKATNTFALQVSNPTATITSTSTSFCIGSSVVLTASAGTSYKWFNGTTQVGTAATYGANTAGAYTVEVTNAAGCNATSAVKQITVTPTITWYADADNDGMGDITNTLNACTKPSGYVATVGDVCPTDANKTAAGNCGCGNTETSCLDCNNTPNGTAVIDNCSICVGGTTGRTACVTTATTNGTSINIQVAPQPFDANTTITVDNLGMIQAFTIISAAGTLVETKEGLHTDAITIGESISSGLYTVIITTEKGIYTTKIVKR